MHPTQSTIEDAANILETVQEAYVRLDSELRFAFINRAAETLLGAPRGDLMGMCIPKLLERLSNWAFAVKDQPPTP
jgi:PAS domain-containing protein